MPEVSVSVSELNEYVRSRLSADPMLRRVSVRGEIGDFKVQAGSGHAYFTLKDAGASLSCTMWRTNLSLLKFIPKTGKKVTVKGQVTLYVPGGRYQLIADSMSEEGQGDLFARFEALKQRLDAEGLFNQEHKRPLPLKVRCIGVATSSSGAAIRDIIKVARARNPHVDIIVAPCAVQGKGAEIEIAAALRALDADGRADVILVGRGGGSMEDLWAFNEEVVARAVYACKTPVISCVGHETDFSICDFVSDVRASTPSNAAELAVADVSALAGELDSLRQRLNRAVLGAQENRRLRLNALMRSAAFADPRGTLINGRRQTLENLLRRQTTALTQSLATQKLRVEGYGRLLKTLDPNNVKKRGYACVRKNGRIVSAVSGLASGDQITVELQDGEADARVEAPSGQK